VEFAKSDTVYVPLNDEIISRIQVTTEIVGDITEDGLATPHVDTLNNDLREAKLTGESAKLVSESIIWEDESIDGTKTIVVVSPEQQDAHDAIGTFMGVSEMIIDQQRTLMYRLSLGIDEATMTARSVLAPVDESNLLIGTQGSAEATLTDAFEGAVRKLNTIKDPDFQDVFTDFMDTIEECEGVNAGYVRGLGLTAAWMMAQDGVVDNPDMQQAITEIILLSIGSSAAHHIVGQDIVFNNPDSDADITIASHDSIGPVRSIGTITDYVIDGQGALIPESSMQPVLVVTDLKGVQRFVPLKFITTFTEASKGDRCHSSMRRFLAMYPDTLRSVE